MPVGYAYARKWHTAGVEGGGVSTAAVVCVDVNAVSIAIILPVALAQLLSYLEIDVFTSAEHF